MRYLRSIMVLLLFASLSCFAQNAKSATAKGSSADKQIQDLVDQRRQAAIKGDASALEATTSDDYVRIGPEGGTMNKAEYLDAIKSGSLKYQSIDLKGDSKIQNYGNAAVSTGSADIKGTYKGHDISGSYRVSQVLVKRNGKWQVVHLQTTRIQ